MPESMPNPETLDQIFERSHRRRWPFLLALALLVALAVWWGNPRGQEGSVFETVPLELRDLIASVSATGQLEPILQVQVGSEISGTVVEVLVDSNDIVERGQVLARIDTTKLEQQTERSRAAWQAARAQLAQAEATLAESEAQLRRFEEVARLSDGKVPSKTELDAARASERRARAGVAASRAAVEEAEAATSTNETDLRKSVIRSPIDGIVLDRDIDPGQTVAASFQAPILFTIGQDLRTMDLTVFVSEADIGKVRSGQMATFTVDAWPELTFEATVKKVSFGSETIENVVSYETDLEVPNEEAKLRPGMTATARIEVSAQNGVVAAPNAALRFAPPAGVVVLASDSEDVADSAGAEGAASKSGDSRGFSFLPRPPVMERRDRGDGSSVYVLRRGSLVRVPVEVGLTDGRFTEIRSPELQVGDEVVVDMVETRS